MSDAQNFGIDGADSGTGPVVGNRQCFINCTNVGEIYAFHAGGAHVLLADGSVRLLTQSISTRVLGRLVTVRGGEPAGEF